MAAQRRPQRPTELAREVLGLGDVSALSQRMDDEKADYPSARVRPDYVRAQDVQELV